MKIITIIGARPQFIKAAAVSREIRKRNNIKEIIIHTGQHFDKNMSDVFFEEMHIPKPDYNLGINSISHGAMTGRMLEETEKILVKEKPDYILIYGDTNSTLAGALAAKKLHIKVAHVEAGLRSYNMKMPEEVNRILTDRISDILLCPTDKAVENLNNEGYSDFDCKIVKSGDVMLDTAIFYSDFEKKPDFKVPEKFIITTIHRAENTDSSKRLQNIFDALNYISQKIPVILPLHPRTKKITEANNVQISSNIKIIKPVGYLEIVYLLKRCSLVMTDSGGMQKEAFFFKKPCITLRNETEWTELTENGYNIIAGADTNVIINSYEEIINKKGDFSKKLYGNGNAAEIIVDEILKNQK
ncbi:MAG: UDP-N-acetylglucosamine 2-epimerase (non-hydrolyzing) [Bacteroidales bacterium]|nr:UDP-N-acetylglucosamine 2-epimerase (non-hydrolyzing) [Bacteroidales bacterium]